MGFLSGKLSYWTSDLALWRDAYAEVKPRLFPREEAQQLKNSACLPNKLSDLLDRKESKKSVYLDTLPEFGKC